MSEESSNKENKPIAKFKGWWAFIADTIAVGQFFGSAISPVVAKAAVGVAVVGIAGGTVLYTKNAADKKVAVEETQTSSQVQVTRKVNTPEEEIAKTELGQRTLNFVKEFNTFIDSREVNRPQTDFQRYDEESIRLYNSQYKPSVTKLKGDFAAQKINGGSAFYYSDQFTLSTGAMRNISNGLVEMASQLK
jgi:hypothetical protein